MKTAWFVGILLLLLVIAGAMRIADISADLPAYFSLGSQDLTTDAAYLTLFAKTAALSGTWDPFGFAPASTLKLSIVSGVSYLLFVLMGVSRATAAITGALLQLAGLAFFVAGCSRWLERRTVLAVAAILTTNYLLVLFGRVPFAEDGLIFLAGLTFWVYSNWFDRDWGKIAVGVLITVTALLGKSFGFLLAGGPLLYLLVHGEQQRVRKLALVLAPIIVLTVCYGLFMQSGRAFFSFLYERGAAQHGSPYGFTSLSGFFVGLIAVSRTGLHLYTPLLSLCAWVALLFMMIVDVRLGDRDRLFYFMLGWMVTWLVCLSPFNYMPVRYLFVLTIPMAVIVGVVVERLLAQPLQLRRMTWWRLIALVMLNWYAVYVLTVALRFHTITTAQVLTLVWQTLPVGAIIALGLWGITRASKRRFSLRYGTSVLIALALLICGSDLVRFLSWFPHRTHMISEACNDVPDLLSSSAVVAGQYGPVLTSASALRGFPMFVSQDITKDAAIFQQYPITHIALGVSDYENQRPSSAILQRSPIITTFWLRDNYVRLVRIGEVAGNPDAQRYQTTQFEQAVDFMYRGKYADAEQLMSQFLAAHPNNKTALVEEYYLTLMVKSVPDAQPIVERLYQRYNSDYSISLLAAIYYKYVAAKTGNQTALAQAEKCYQNALWYGTEVRGDTEQMYATLSPIDRIMK